MHFCRRYGLWHKHHFLTENECFLVLDEDMTLQKTQLYCSGKVTTDQFWVPWYHRRSQGTNISILYHAPNYAPSIYDTTVRSRVRAPARAKSNFCCASPLKGLYWRKHLLSKWWCNFSLHNSTSGGIAQCSGRAIDCRSIGPWFNSECPLQTTF